MHGQNISTEDPIQSLITTKSKQKHWNSQAMLWYSLILWMNKFMISWHCTTDNIHIDAFTIFLQFS